MSRMCSISPTGSPVSGTWLMGSSTASAMVCRSTMPSSVTRAAEHPPASSSRMVKSELTPNWARRYTRLSINEGTIGWGGGGGGASFSRPPLDWNSSFRESNIARFLPFCPLCRQGAFLPKKPQRFRLSVWAETPPNMRCVPVRKSLSCRKNKVFRPCPYYA